MFQTSWWLAGGLLLMAVWPAHAQISKGVMSVTGGQMP